jgi:ADP-heptose:LPS heptosyltransferase
MNVRTALKHVERTARRSLLSATAALLGTPARAATPDWGAGEQRVLFLRHDRIGDMILSTGILDAIARAQPTITLDVLASPLNAPVLAANPGLGDVLTVDRKRPWTWPALLLRLRRARYDVVIDCMVTAPSLTTLLLVLASHARHRVGVARRGNDFVYDLPVEPIASAAHIVEHLGALAQAFGVDPTTADVAPRIALTADEHDAAELCWREIDPSATCTRLLVNVSSGKAARHWPDDRFVAVLARARERAPGLRVALIAAPGEAARARTIARAGGATYAATSSVRHAFALVAHADRVFTPDTSIAHAASAFGKPAVVMYLAGKAALWGLYGAPGENLESPDQSLASLPVEPVLHAIDVLVDPTGDPAAHRYAM